MRSLLGAALMAAVTLGCASSKGYLAEVNGEGVTGTDLKREFGRRHASLEKYMGGDEELVRKFLDSVIDRRLFLQEAARIGVPEEADIVADVREFEARKAQELLLDRMLAASAPTDEEIQAAFEKLGTFYVVREIVAWEKPDADAIAAELKGGADFEALARSRSISPSAKYGGRIGVVQWGSQDERSEAVILALADGAVSEPFQVDDDHWRILKLDRREPAENKPDLAKATPYLTKVIEGRKFRAAERALNERLWTAAEAKVVCAECGYEALLAAKDGKDDSLAATWKDGRLTRGDFAASLKLDRVGALPADRRDRQLRRLLVASVREKLLRAEALATGLAADPKVAEPVARRREQLVEGRLFSAYVFRGLRVTDDEVKALYDRKGDALIVAERRKVAQVVAPSFEAAKAYRERLHAGASYVELQKEALRPGEEPQGDAAGWLTAKELPEGFSVVFSLARGDVSQPLKSEMGYHVVKVLEIVPAHRLELAEVREQLHEELLDEKRQARVQEWAAKLRETASIKVSRAAIRRYVKENPPVPLDQIPDAPSGHGGGGGGKSPGMMPAGHGGMGMGARSGPAPHGPAAGPLAPAAAPAAGGSEAAPGQPAPAAASPAGNGGQ